METGLKRRLARLQNTKSERSLFIAMDHGFTTGPLPGFEHYRLARKWAGHSAIDGLLMHKGALKAFTNYDMALPKSVILQANGMSKHAANPSDKPMMVEVEDALRLGADAISVEFSAQLSSFGDNLKDISAQINAADRMNLPVMVMLGINQAPSESEAWVKLHRDVTRALIEIGASIIKLRQPPHADDWEAMLDGLHQDVRIVMAGGSRDSDETVLKRARIGLKAGAAGMCIGRNVFQNGQPNDFIDSLADVLNTVDPAEQTVSVDIFDPKFRSKAGEARISNELVGEPL
ncbi:putative aldolase LsrF [Pseudovibrio axinellae]|uniref:Putative aldolase LsrF n=1 Tax=Pseudovibrio axinellae TaxID=989403 RepID=A0A165U0Q0_9HYPH|nr:hypothetical protein [Pseudovibrio axinellae]KZL09101.1 putative aldolase LsrF [Pseudovibrio axinellae]SER75367.1 fructose-bisphosphate aldolase, class I/fructose-bisphosphate aldolase / 2-amino-3,7-dideoxy-D-threo-hept-6-ulosonate synthase/2-amino-4,5-dihydroxy-6-oxo-7-(phosphonooxy)heptanoate synthase [Pseudovibrio axinellae]